MTKKAIYILLFCSLVLPLYIQAAPKKRAKSKTVNGMVHFYGSRYILKENTTKGEWFILLESFTLEDLVKKLDPTQVYEVKGKLYEFNRNKYLLPEKFKKAKTKAKSKKATKKKKKTKAKKK